MFNFLFNEHHGKTAAVCGILTAVLAVTCCYGDIASKVAYNVCAGIAMVSCVCGLICLLFEANEEWV